MRQPGHRLGLPTPNYQARNSASKPHCVLAGFPSPGVLNRMSPLITASPFCPWTLLSRPGRHLSLEPHSTPVPAGSTLPHPGSRGDATHRDLMSVGLDPPQIAARGPLPKPQSHSCCGWKGRGGKREAIGMGFASHRPWHHLALSWLLTSLKCPLSPDGSSAFSLYAPSPLPNSWPRVVAVACDVFSIPGGC